MTIFLRNTLSVQHSMSAAKPKRWNWGVFLVVEHDTNTKTWWRPLLSGGVGSQWGMLGCWSCCDLAALHFCRVVQRLMWQISKCKFSLVYGSKGTDNKAPLLFFCCQKHSCSRVEKLRPSGWCLSHWCGLTGGGDGTGQSWLSINFALYPSAEDFLAYRGGPVHVSKHRSSTAWLGEISVLHD